MKWYIPLAYLRPHSPESDYIEFFEQKKKIYREAYDLFCHVDFILACRAKFLILFCMTRSMIRDLIRDSVRDPIPDQVRYPIRDPIPSAPVQSKSF